MNRVAERRGVVKDLGEAYVQKRHWRIALDTGNREGLGCGHQGVEAARERTGVRGSQELLEMP